MLLSSCPKLQTLTLTNRIISARGTQIIRLNWDFLTQRIGRIGAKLLRLCKKKSKASVGVGKAACDLFPPLRGFQGWKQVASIKGEEWKMQTFLSIQRLLCQTAHFNGDVNVQKMNACFSYHFHLPDKLVSFVFLFVFFPLTCLPWLPLNASRRSTFLFFIFHSHQPPFFFTKLLTLKCLQSRASGLWRQRTRDQTEWSKSMRYLYFILL